MLSVVLWAEQHYVDLGLIPGLVERVAFAYGIGGSGLFSVQ